MNLSFRSRTAGYICAALLCGLLIAGLWPFSYPRNDVTWIDGHQAVRFGKHGTIFSNGSFVAPDDGPCTVEMSLRPDRSDDSSTLVGFYGPQGDQNGSLNQSLTDLRLDSAAGPDGVQKLYIDGFFKAGKRVFLTAVFGPKGTTIYWNGAAIQRSSKFRLAPHLCNGEFVVGDSPNAHHSWHGEIHGLALYRQELSAAQVAANYRSWQTTGRPEPALAGEHDLVYLFKEAGGRLIGDSGPLGLNLTIPERYSIAHEEFLKSPWAAFEAKWGYVEDIVINIGGFVPFGFMLSVWLASFTRLKRAAALAVLLGFLVSLTIEALQVFLPTRNSDLTDVLTNTLGTWLGVMLHRSWLRRLL